MANFQISLGLSKMSYKALATFAQAIHNGFVLLVAIFGTPNPLMALFQTHIDALNDCIQAWDSKATRTRTDLNNLRAARNTVRNDLRMLADYAMNIRPNDPDIWQQVGFELRAPRSGPISLQIVRDFRIFISRLIGGPEIRLKWVRPLGARKGDVKVYVIQCSNTPAQQQLKGNRGIVNIIGLTTDTSIMVEPPFVGANYFWVTGFNAAGYGVSSDVLMYNAPGKIA